MKKKTAERQAQKERQMLLRGNLREQNRLDLVKQKKIDAVIRSILVQAMMAGSIVIRSGSLEPMETSQFWKSSDSIPAPSSNTKTSIFKKIVGMFSPRTSPVSEANPSL